MVVFDLSHTYLVSYFLTPERTQYFILIHKSLNILKVFDYYGNLIIFTPKENPIETPKRFT